MILKLTNKREKQQTSSVMGAEKLHLNQACTSLSFRKQRQKDYFQVCSQPDVHSEFQANKSFTVRSSLKESKTKQ